METSIVEIGSGLTSYAREEAEYSARGILGELFPFVLQASKRMSTRAISRWLAETHGVKLSAVSIAKALRNPERYWDEYIEMLEPILRQIEEATNCSIHDLLAEPQLFHHISLEPERHFHAPTTPEQYDDDLRDFVNALGEVEKRWFVLDESTRAKAAGAIHRFSSGEGNEDDETTAHRDSQ